MKLLRGKKIAAKILTDLKKAIIKEKMKPGLAVVLVGENKASKVYVNLKKKAAREIGVDFHLYKFKEIEREKAILEKIDKLNRDRKIHGIIVQLPLPKKLNTRKIIAAIDPRKDADGFSNKSKIDPVFPRAIMLLIKNSRQKIAGKQGIVLSNSKEFGSVMVKVIKKERIRAGYILSKNLKINSAKIKTADIIVAAIGRPGLLSGDMVKKGAIVIDGGITKIGKKVLGDVDFESVKNKAAFLSPVPGGVGPVTIACLLENVYLLAKQKPR